MTLQFEFNGRARVEDGELCCASTLCNCNEYCQDYYICKPVKITVEVLDDADTCD